MHSRAAQRLATLKCKASKSVATIEANWQPGEARDRYIAQQSDWRAHRSRPFRHGGAWQDAATVKRPDERAYYVDSFDVLGWRNHGRADEVSKAQGSRTVDHSGWFTREDDYSETVAGYVLQLPARASVPQYIPAIAWSDCDGITVYPLDTYDEPLEAARAADQYAEKQAESEREHDAAWQAGAQYAALGDEIAELRSEALALLVNRRDTVAPAPVLELIRSRIADICEAIANKRDKRAELADVPHRSWDAELTASLQGSFNEGAQTCG